MYLVVVLVDCLIALQRILLYTHTNTSLCACLARAEALRWKQTEYKTAECTPHPLFFSPQHTPREPLSQLHIKGL
jgi:hypothetical protein